jgi:hypothetical protein
MIQESQKVAFVQAGGNLFEQPLVPLKPELLYVGTAQNREHGVA